MSSQQTQEVHRKEFSPGTMVGGDGKESYEIEELRDGGGEAFVYRGRSLSDGHL
ncbi:hypothetical protein GF391_00655, partial [Candidatus Uhrbacteria bacterium]|nr:hypothetical protein [Candidatus Uhrbacteria bacterium]